MLASILIRIALADAFGGVCSMIALDEPTTNLDRDKVDKSGISEIPGKREKKIDFRWNNWPQCSTDLCIQGRRSTSNSRLVE